MAVGYGWSDILYMGKDLEEEYEGAEEAVLSQKYKNKMCIRDRARALAESGKEPPMLYTACGTEDYGLPLCREFHEYLNSLGLKNQFITQPGIHDYYFANRILKYTLDELFQIEDPLGSEHIR